MKLSVVLSTQPAQFAAATFQGDLDTGLANIAALGYQGVELAIRDPNLLDADILERLIHARGLKVPAIGTGQAWGEEGLSFTDPDLFVRTRAIERISCHIRLAARWGAVIIIGLIRGVARPGVNPAQAMDWLVEALAECAHRAHGLGVRLALEPINRYETNLINNAEQGLELIQRVGAGNLGLLLDTFHMNVEEPQIEQSILRCGPRIFHFHVADSNRLHPGAGHLDFQTILGALMETGYMDWVSGEFLPQPDALTAARNSMNYLSRIRAAHAGRPG